MADRYPGYDVLKKRNTVSWNDQTRTVIDRRLAIDSDQHLFFNDDEWATVRAICDRVIPQPAGRASPAPIAAMIDEKLHSGCGDGYRDARLPAMREAWRRALDALDREAKERYGRRFHELEELLQDDLLAAIQKGDVSETHWHGLPATLFFSNRLLHDIVSAYYAHPHAWNEIGFGGPASPRGYVRMNFDRRDPWEASEARPGREQQARRENARVG
jgi:hypothetical protein